MTVYKPVKTKWFSLGFFNIQLYLLVDQKLDVDVIMVVTFLMSVDKSIKKRPHLNRSPVTLTSFLIK